MKKQTVVNLLLFSAIVLVLLGGKHFACQGEGKAAFLQLHGQTMGTTWSASVVVPPGGATVSPGYAIQRALNRVDSLMTTYRPNSELMRFNKNPSTKPVVVSAEFAQVVAMALRVSKMSDGALDITVWPLVELWGFGVSDAPAQAPSQDTLRSVAGRIGYQKLEVDLNAGTLRKSQGDVFCDVSAVAKGYGVDQAWEALETAGYRNFLVEVGGELRARGRHPSGRAWTIAVEKPDPEKREATIRIPLVDLAAATSGSYRNFVELGGRRRSHILDPRTLAPVDHGLVSVTVLHPQTAVADAWATALMVLGPDRGYEKAREAGLPAYFLTEGPDGVFTPRWTDDWPPFEGSVN